MIRGEPTPKTNRPHDPMIKTLVSSDSLECSAYCFWLNCYKIGASLIPHPL